MKTNFYKKFSRFGLTLGGYLTALCQVTTTHFSKQQSRHSPAWQASGQRTGGQASGQRGISVTPELERVKAVLLKMEAGYLEITWGPKQNAEAQQPCAI